MPELPVASSGADMLPPVFLEEPDDFAHLHGFMFSRKSLLTA